MPEYSGRFVLRIPPDLHARASRIARERGLSLNEYCRTAIDACTDAEVGNPGHGPFGGRWVQEAQRVVGDALEGVVLFGSQARGQGRASSDVDLLIVIAATREINRDTYRHWDSSGPDRRVSPHFVHLPGDVSSAGSIWYEVAVDGIILHEENQKVSAFLRSVRGAIADGNVRRRYAHGHPYWVRNTGGTDA